MNGGQKEFIKLVNDIVYGVLNNEKLLRGEWRGGVVDTPIDSRNAKVFIDGGIISQKVSVNPDISLVEGDSVWVVFINNDSKRKFVISKR